MFIRGMYCKTPIFRSGKRVVSCPHQVCLLRCHRLWSHPSPLWFAIRDDSIATTQSPITPHSSATSLAGVLLCKVIIVRFNCVI